MESARLIEIFTSFQGEGPHVGEEMTFVRFQQCALSCRFCDTPESFMDLPKFRFERQPHSASWEERDNPVSGEELTRLVDIHGGNIMSLTGGEPLQHASFLRSWLPSLRGRYRILLETNGVLPRALEGLIDLTDIVSMDLKLPSVTGMRSYWEEHREFLEIAHRREVYCKVVVGGSTCAEDLKQAIALVASVDPRIPFILQPVTPAREVKNKIAPTELQELFRLSSRRLPDVRVIPQIHPVIGVL